MVLKMTSLDSFLSLLRKEIISCSESQAAVSLLALVSTSRPDSAGGCEFCQQTLGYDFYVVRSFF